MSQSSLYATRRRSRPPHPDETQKRENRGVNGLSAEERDYFRDAPLMIVGEGTNEIQRNVIAAQLIARGGLDR